MLVDKTTPALRSQSKTKASIFTTALKTELQSIDDQNQSKFAIETDRIRRILQEAFFKLKVTLSLSTLIANEPELLTDYLEKEEAELILTTFPPAIQLNKSISKEFLGDLNVEEEFIFGETVTKISVTSSERSRDTEGEEESTDKPITQNETTVNDESNAERPVAHFIGIIDSLMKCKGLTKILNDYEIKGDSLEGCLTADMQKLLGHVVEEFEIEAKIRKEKESKMAYAFGLIMDGNILALEESSARHDGDFKEKENQRFLVIAEHKDKLKSLQQRQKLMRDKTIADSESEIMRYVNVSEQEQEHLKLVAEGLTQEYESLLQNSLRDEKELHNRLKKVEVQIAAWASKYDADMSERQTEVDKMVVDIEKLYGEMGQLQGLLCEQEYLYLQLMGERDQEEEALFEAALYKFLCNRAARTIQRAWRAYRIRRLLRKKKAKGKKGSDKKGRKGKKKDDTTAYVKGLEKREHDKQEGAKEKEKTLEQKFGDDMFAGLTDNNPSAFTNKEKEVRLSEI